MVRLIKTESEYENTLARITQLMGADPGTEAGEELDLLVHLVEVYEEKNHPIGISNPIDMIKFVMEQNNLTQKDLIPILGSRSKVSEVLSGRRQLSLSMMRALNKHLGIPADVLLAEPDKAFPEQPKDIDWEVFPHKEMMKRGWIEKVKDWPSQAEDIMRRFIAQAGGMEAIPQAALLRQGITGRTNVKTDNYALFAWCLRIIQIAKQDNLPARYKPGTVDFEFLQRVAKLSFWSKGPELAKEFLNKHGIHLIVLEHLPKTYLDGAVLLLPDGAPVIGLTLRFDRVDNFWFALLHELSHLKLHIEGEVDLIVDDHSLRTKENEDRIEGEADQMADKALIPDDLWENHPVRRNPKQNLVIALAKEFEIDPAIIAGRIRYEQNNYRLLSRLVGQGEVRKHFE